MGMKCRECGLQHGGVLFTLSPGQAASALAVGLVFGVVAGWGVAFQSSFGFFMVFLAVAYGTFAGEMILRASGRKRGIKMEVLAGVVLAVGAIGGRMVVAALLIRASGGIRPPLGVLDVIVHLVFPSPIPLISLIIAIASAVGRIRYIYSV